MPDVRGPRDIPFQKASVPNQAPGDARRAEIFFPAAQCSLVEDLFPDLSDRFLLSHCY